MSSTTPTSEQMVELRARGKNAPTAIYHHIESAKVKEKVNKTQNKIIKGTILENYKFFENKLMKTLQERYIFSDQKVKHAFYDICLNPANFVANNPLEMIKQYIFNRTNNIQNSKEDTAQLNEVIVDIFIRSLQAHESGICGKVLNWIVEDISTMGKIKPLIEKWINDILSECVENENLEALNKILDGCGTSDVVKNRHNTVSMIRACEKNNYEMILAFLYFGFTVDDKQFKDEKEEKTKSQSQVDKIGARHSKHNAQLEQFKLFCATSEAAYLLANFKVNSKNEDPISAAFLNSHIARRQKQKTPEYRNKYLEVRRKGERFIVTMLDLCRSTHEAVLFLSYDFNLNNVLYGKNEMRTDYPRLFLAVEERHKQFVTHDYCQQVLRNRWHQSDVTREVIPWQTYGNFDSIVYYLRTFVLLPIYIICYLVSIFYNRKKRAISLMSLDQLDGKKSVYEPYYKQDYLEEDSMFRKIANHLFNFFTFPCNRAVATMISQLVFFFICFGMTIFKPHSQLTLIDYVIIAWAIGCFLSRVNYLIDSQQTFGFHAWFKTYLNPICEIIFVDFVMFAGFIMILFDSFNCQKNGMSKEWNDWCNDNGTYTPYKEVLELGQLGRLAPLPEYSWPKIGYSLLGFAFTFNVIRIILSWANINPWLGPIAISIKAVLKDVFPTLFFYVMFLITFSLGLHYSLGLSTFKADCELHSCNFDVEADDNKFRDLKTAFKTVLWSLFDPGHPEVVGCVEWGFPKVIGYFLWSVYNYINIVLLLNLLIALMTNTIYAIDKDSTMEWKFSRTRMWIRYIIVDSYLPSPFNILEFIFKYLNKSLCLLRCKEDTSESSESEEIPEIIKKRYNDLMVQLAERYLHVEEDSEENEVTKEDLNNAKRDIIRSFKKMESMGTFQKKRQRIISQYYS